MNSLLKIDDAKYVRLIERIRTLIKDRLFEGKVYIVGGNIKIKKFFPTLPYIY